MTLVWKTISSNGKLPTILICFIASFRHAASEIVQEHSVLADTFDIDRIAAAKAGSHTCASAIR